MNLMSVFIILQNTVGDLLVKDDAIALFLRDKNIGSIDTEYR